MSDKKAVSLGEDLACAVITAISLIICFVAGGFTGARSGYQSGVVEQQKEAIKAGAGRWVIDAETGEKKFVYGKGE